MADDLAGSVGSFGPPDPASRTDPARPPAQLVVFPPERFAAGAAGVLAERLREAAASGRLSLALAGGSTPRPVYRALAGTTGLPWERVEICFGDERRVPPAHPASNFRMAREALLDHIPVPAERVHRLRGEADDPHEEALRYERRLPHPLDLLLLGVGEDGHTASLFPRHPALEERERRVLAVEGPTPPTGRYTLTPPVLAAARELVVLACGASKAAAVARALEGAWDPRSCPAQLARRGTWLLDEAAAGPPGDPDERATHR